MPERDPRWEHHDREHAIAEKHLDRRLAELNKLREEVVDDRTQYLRVDAYQAEHKALRLQVDSRIDALLLRMDVVEKLMDQAQGAVATWRFIALFAGLPGLIALISIILSVFEHVSR